MKIWLSATLLLFSISLRAADFDEQTPLGVSFLPYKPSRSYIFYTHEPNVFHGLVSSIGLKDPIFKILPLAGEVKPFFQDTAQKFVRPEIMSEQQMLNFFKSKKAGKLRKFSIALAPSMAVVSNNSNHDLLKFITNPVFVGTMAIDDQQVVHLFELPKNKRKQELDHAYQVAKSFFLGLFVQIHSGEKTIGTIALDYDL